MRNHPGMLVRRLSLALLAGAVAALSAAALPAVASANSSQISIIQDNLEINYPAIFNQFRAVGANTARVILPWALVAPGYRDKKKPNFNATDPAAYGGAWAPFDNIVRQAAVDGIKVDLTVTGGAPIWAEGAKIPPNGHFNPYWAWKPNAKDFGQFMQAAATRYSGHYKPAGQSTALPGVHFWSIWNEPNFGEDLGPQATDGSRISVAPNMLRNLLGQGWKALKGNSSHKHDTIIWGEFAARGISIIAHKGVPLGDPGDFGQTKPLTFIRTLYCLDGKYRELRGKVAKAEGCPTSAKASRSFRKNNPALFQASGVSDHPYPLNQSPVKDGKNDPNFAAFPDLGNFGHDLDRSTAVYGAHPHYSIYNTEYGYITRPPDNKHFVTQATAAWYINWAEYLSYKNGRIRSYMQYLLYDPKPKSKNYSGFASGLLTNAGKPKATLNAYRMPLYMPHTKFKKGENVEVWGAARPAQFASLDGFGTQRVNIQEKFGNTWKTINTAKVGRGGYFDIHMKFSSSGRIRSQWTYPKTEGLLSENLRGTSITSRTFPVQV
jgi:hypothetical protein